MMYSKLSFARVDYFLSLSSGTRELLNVNQPIWLLSALGSITLCHITFLYAVSWRQSSNRVRPKLSFSILQESV